MIQHADVIERDGRVFVFGALQTDLFSCVTFHGELGDANDAVDLGEQVMAALDENEWVEEIGQTRHDELRAATFSAVGVKSWRSLCKGARNVSISRRELQYEINPLVRSGDSFVNPEYEGLEIPGTELIDPTGGELGAAIQRVLERCPIR